MSPSPEPTSAPREGLAGLVALVLAAAAIATRLTPDGGLPPFGGLATWAGALASSLALLAGLVARCSEPEAAGDRAGLRSLLPSRADLTLAMPSALLLWPLPLLSDALSTAALAGLSLFLLAARARRDVALVPTDARGRGALDLHARALLGLVGLFALLYLGVALEMVGGRDNDASYYFGVARWIAAHGTLDEPIVWHFLSPPRALVHPAFDYWQGLTSVLLALPLALFGRTHLVASVTMALLSAASLLGFAYLVVIARPFRGRATQLAAIVAFALSPAMQEYRFDTETIVVFHLGLLGALIALAHDRLALAAGLAFLVFLTRADGLVTCGLVWLFALGSALRRRPQQELFGHERRRRALRTALAMGGALGLYVASNLARFGTPTPPGARMAPFLGSYLDIYVWDPSRRPGRILELLASRLDRAQLEAAVERVRGTFDQIDYLLRPEVLPAALALGLLVLFRPRADRGGLHRLALALVIVGSVTIAWLSPVVFSEGRTLHPLLPAMALAAFASFELVPRWLRRALRRRPEAARVAFALSSALVLVPTLALARPYRPLAILRAGFEADLAQIDPILDGAPVATTSPWWVIANTESPAVLLPAQTDDDLVAVLERYDVRFVLFTTGDDENWGPGPWAVWAPLRDGLRARLGPYRLEHVESRPTLVLYRLVRDG
jgi:hypothetical protein